MENVMYQILSLVLTIIGLIITYYVIPILRSKVSDEKLSIVEMWVNIAVAAAEQMKVAGLLPDGQEKKEYVLQFIRDKGITITDEELDALIEAAVYEINKAKYLLFKDLDMSDVESLE
jgi:LL-H family phage holin